MSSSPTSPRFCAFCGHPNHQGYRCTQCRCKGKPKWWRVLLDNLGTALGQAKFGGDR